MFLPNNTCTMWRATGALDIHGQASYGAALNNVPCAVVTLNLKLDKTSVRADSSGSRGKAEEEQGDAMLLFPTYITIQEKDVVTVDGEVLEIISVFPRRNILGTLDHFEVVLRKGTVPS